MRLRTLAALGLLVGTLAAGLGVAHEERPAEFPDGSGAVPVYRTTGPALVVCKADSGERIKQLPPALRARNEELLGQCAFEHIQAAVDAVTAPGARILVLPGVYREEPSLAPAPPDCVALEGQGLLSYDEQRRCPHVQNLIAVLGDDAADEGIQCGDSPTERLCALQVEGTGERPGDVIVDGAWQRLNVVRVDRADGFYLRNLLVQRSTFNSVYILETDGFAIDRAVARWNEEYGFLTFADDHGLYVDCEAYGNGDAGLYPGSASDLHGARPAIEISRCDSHHNMAGFSGTAGNSVFAHDNDFHHNAVGAVMDSVFPNHPGLPQDSSTFVRNRVYSNNINYYDNFVGPDAPCDRPVADRGIEDGVVCPSSPVPVGTGFLTAGGNANLFADNQVWDNWRFAAMLFSVPAILREETDPAKQLDTSHFNRYLHNALGVAPDGSRLPNGLDFWWDEGGAGNCWQANAAPGGVTSDPMPLLLPDCDAMPITRAPNPAKTARLAPCALFDRNENPRPVGCDWMTTPPRPG